MADYFCESCEDLALTPANEYGFCKSCADTLEVFVWGMTRKVEK